MTKIKNGIMNIFSILSYVVYLNILWLLFSLVGLVIFGIGPATSALLKASKLYLHDRTETTFKEFVINYRAYFLKANYLQLIFYFSTALIMLNYRISVIYFPTISLLKVVYLVLFIIVFLTSLYAFPNLVEFPEQSLAVNLKLALFLAFRFPLKSLTLVLTLTGCYLILTLKSALPLFFGASLPFVLCFYLYSQTIKEARQLFQNTLR